MRKQGKAKINIKFEILVDKKQDNIIKGKPIKGIDSIIAISSGKGGVGKTTTIGKLASQFRSQGLAPLLVAADTFRAAAIEQLQIWSERNDVPCIAGKPNADPSSVIVDGFEIIII